MWQEPKERLWPTVPVQRKLLSELHWAYVGIKVIASSEKHFVLR